MQKQNLTTEEAALEAVKNGHKQMSGELLNLLNFAVKEKYNVLKEQFEDKKSRGFEFSDKELKLIDEFFDMEIITTDEREFYDSFDSISKEVEWLIFNKNYEIHDMNFDSYEGLVKKLLRLGKQEHIKSIGLGANRLSTLKAAYKHIASSFSFIPRHIEALNLDWNHFGELDFEKLKKLLELLPSGLKYLDLGVNKLGKYDFRDFADLMDILPKDLEYLDLDSNDIEFSITEWSIVLEKLPQNLKHLSIKSSNIEKLGGFTLLTFLGFLPSSIVSLDVGQNRLGWRNDVDDFIKALPKGLKELGLGHNNLGESEEILDVISNLPSGLLKLDIGWNDFWELEVDTIYDIIKALPKGLKSLSLEKSSLNRHSVDEFKEILRLLPSGIKELDLSNNRLSELKIEDLQSIMSSLPPSLEKLILSDNNWDKDKALDLGIRDGIRVVY